MGDLKILNLQEAIKLIILCYFQMNLIILWFKSYGKKPQQKFLNIRKRGARDSNTTLTWISTFRI